jgi:hypothetical protein
VAVANVDGSGPVDLIVGTQYRDAIYTLLNTGSGAFNVATNTSVTNGAGYPVSLAAADFNHDDILDLALAREFPPAGIAPVTVLLGRGDGSFVWATNYAPGSYSSIAAGDVNGDQEIDLVAGTDNGQVAVFLGNGDGSFTGPTTYAVGSRTIGWDIVLGDFNGDQKLDIIASGRYDKKVVVLIGSGDGSFQITTNYALTNGPERLVVSDANNDGKLDVIAVNSSSNSISVLLGNRDGTFQSPIDLGLNVPSTSVAIGDFNGDGLPDLITANYLTTNINVLLATGDGRFTPAAQLPLAASLRPQSVAVADFDGDGRPDIVAACFQLDPHAVPRAGVMAVFHNETPPALKIKMAGSLLELNWPAWPGYNLQFSTNLSAPEGWLAVTDVPFLSGNQNVLTVFPDSRSHFYRLQKP